MANEADVRELWEAINDLRGGDARILAAIEGLKASIDGRNGRMDERCDTRLTMFTEFNSRLRGLEDKYVVLDKQQVRLIVITSAITAALAILGNALVMKLVSAMMSGH